MARLRGMNMFHYEKVAASSVGAAMASNVVIDNAGYGPARSNILPVVVHSIRGAVHNILAAVGRNTLAQGRQLDSRCVFRRHNRST